MGPYIAARFMNKARERSKQQNGQNGRFSTGERSGRVLPKNKTGDRARAR
jgi:hypothetical protein